MDKRLKEITLYAWLGEDELGSGEIGIKRGRVPAGDIPLVAVDEEKMGNLSEQLDAMGKHFNRRISLCKFKFDGVIKEVGKQEP